MNDNELTKFEWMAKDLINYYCPLYSFMWDKSVKRKGQCRCDVKQIGISKPLAKLNTAECMLLTVTHEIAHALARGHGHDEVWKQTCLNIGGDGRHYYNPNETILVERKWTLFCDGKPTSLKRFRRTTIRNPRYEWRKV